MPNITPIPSHSLTSKNCPISPVFLLLFSSSQTLSHVRRQKHGALLTGLIGSLNSSLPFSLSEHSPHTGSGIPVLRLVLPCLFSCLVSFYLDSVWVTDLLVVRYLVSCPTLSTLFLNFWPLQLSHYLSHLLFTTHCGLIACI